MNAHPKDRNIGDHEWNIQSTYIDHTHQLQQPRGQRPRTADEAVVEVVHEIWLMYKRFRHTRAQDDLLVLVKRAQYLETLGYTLVLMTDAVGATRKGDDTCSIVH